MAFTPGPWKWRVSRTMMHLQSESIGHFGVSMPSPGHRSYVYEGSEKVEANAALIAAAPDLYKSLKEALPIFESMDIAEEDGDEPIPLIAQIRQALSKAEGKV